MSINFLSIVANERQRSIGGSAFHKLGNLYIEIELLVSVVLYKRLDYYSLL